jgi:hypothetical protein
MDRVDLMCSAKEVCREMSAPTKRSWSRLKRLVRYVLKYPRGEWRFPTGVFSKMDLRVYSDSDWAGCRDSRRSTSGGALIVDGVVLKAWSSTQATVATSSGEAELHAVVKAASEGLGFQSIAHDIGFDLRLELVVDSSAAQSIVSCVGLGKLKHVEVKWLWIQQAVAAGRVAVSWIPGSRNPADVMTKPHNAERFVEMLGRIGYKLVCCDVPCMQCVGVTCAGSPLRWADFEADDLDFSCCKF